ncbi:MAG: VCBS repeat-containing protein [Saprospiraceae bacterium]|nr:VCBS repeat-containing protein [Saprospiraceae bacterium]
MAEQKNSPSSIINSPKGGGAMHGLGEKFSPDLFTGTGNFTIPIALPQGRNGFQPQINLVYSSGQGNGPFGLGWSLSIPGISRQTAKGIPEYDDQEDTFILSGAEDLIPVKKTDAYTEYQPRTEGLFARIRYYRDQKNAYWEVKTKDGLTSIYGSIETFGQEDEGQSGVCYDPANPARIFSWKLTKTADPFGNIIRYTYKRDTGSMDGHYWDQLYLTKIEYVEYEPGRFLSSVEFNYDEDLFRPDPFSEFKSGFEIRTRWRCDNILVKSNLANDSFIHVRRYSFAYDNSSLNKVSLLTSVLVTGFDDAGNELHEMPPLEFKYSQFDPLSKRDFFPVTGDDLPPVAMSNPDFEIADLTGNGLPDIFQLNGVARFWKNLGNGRYGLPRSLKERPPVALSDPGVQLMDANGDGRIDLMVTDGAFSGFFSMEHGHQPDWERRTFQKFKTAPSFNLKDPEVKWIDLTGDGITDVLRSGARFECYFFDPKDGWEKTRFWPKKNDLAEFPDVQFSDARVKWADMSGDTMQDLVLVHDGNIEYYPNLGYGRFGKRLRIKNSPRFPYGYDPRRILLGDVDGDGLADLIYVDDRQITLWINQCGNAWSEPIVIPGTPPMTDQDAVRLIDLKGSGVSGILWSRDMTGDGRPHMFFLDLTGGGKPYVLNEMNNNIGSITKVEYASSSEYYLLDEQERRYRWKTSLPMPVQVVKKVEVIDGISETKLTTAYRYHHGYWDGLEREFRGFGMVEQSDSLTALDFNSNGLHPKTGFNLVISEHFSPPILTKSWFHQGPIRQKGNEWVEADYSNEYWQGDTGFWDRGQMLQDVLKNNQLKPHEKRDALRVLRGSILRTELYALDGSERQDRPYTVTEARYDVKFIENNLKGNRPQKPIYFPIAVSQRTTQWERGTEPMTQFAFSGEYDDFGQPQVQTQIACYYGWKSLSDKTGVFLATRTRTLYASPDVENEKSYIHDRVAGVKQWEITRTKGKTIEEIVETPDTSPDLHCIGHTLTFYDGAAYQGHDWGKIEKYGAPVRSESLILTPDILKQAYQDTLYEGASPAYFNEDEPAEWTAAYPADFRKKAGTLGYVFHPGTDLNYETGYYTISDRKKYDFHINESKKGKGLPVAMLDPFADTNLGEPNNHKTNIEYDNYQLLPVKVTQVMSTPPPGKTGLEMTARYNYRVFQPEVVTDPNGNETRFEYSPMGLLTATWLWGNPAQSEGDRREASTRMEYNFLAFKIHRDPVWVKTIKRTHHDTQGISDDTIETREYSDGFGRVVQTRTQAEEEIFGDENFANGILPQNQSDIQGTKRAVTCQKNTDADNPNVIVSGWQVYDNKGQVIEKFEPFFDKGWDYAAPLEEKKGKSIQMRYDPRGQVVRTINPDGSEQRVVYGIPQALNTPDDYLPTPWVAYTYDPNDLAVATGLDKRAPETHHYTPSHIEIDPMGRTILAVQRLSGTNLPGDDLIATRSAYDIRGNLTVITDALGRDAFKHAYDLANRPLLIDSIDAGKRTTIYDAMGNLTERRDERGALILQAYDDLNRPENKWARNKADQPVTLREKIVYGESSGLPNLLGKPWKQYDEAGLVILHAYDFKGNLLKKERQTIADAPVRAALVAGIPFIVDWNAPPPLDTGYLTDMQYDALNRVMELTYPEDVSGGARKVLKPVYNRAGALEKVQFDGETYVERIAYNAKGQRTLIAYGNSMMTRYAYDPDTFRLVRLRTEKYDDAAPITYQPDGKLVQDFAYTYDLVGNILTIRDITNNCGVKGADQLTRYFEYDAIYRLRSATGRECNTAPPSSGNATIDNWIQSGFCEDPTLTRGCTQEYSYDKMGNMLQLKHIAGDPNNYTKDYTVEKKSNRLKTADLRGTSFHYHYDANGNMIREALSRHYEWDHSDRLIRFRVDDATPQNPNVTKQAAYLYDAAGMRVKKVVLKQGGAWDYTRTSIDGLLESTVNDQGEQNNHLHVMDNQSRIAIRRIGADMEDRRPPLQYHLGDHLGSSNIVLGGMDASGNAAIGREEYYPYGSTSFGDYAKKRYRYSGKEKDEESGLYYYGARYYAGWLGRWVSCDPIGIKGGSINIFQFCASNPINFKDKVGLSNLPANQATGTAAAKEGIKYVEEATGVILTEEGHLEKVVASGKGGSRLDIYIEKLLKSFEIKGMDMKNYLDKNGKIDAAKLNEAFSKFFRQNYKHMFHAYEKGKFIQEELLVFVKNASNKQIAAINAIFKASIGEASEKYGIPMKGTLQGMKGHSNVQTQLGLLTLLLIGHQIYSGGQTVAEGNNEGYVDIGQGAVDLFMAGAPFAKGVAVGSVGAVLSSSLCASASTYLLSKTVKSAIKSEATPIDVADKSYGTHIGDLYQYVDPFGQASYEIAGKAYRQAEDFLLYTIWGK